MNIKRTQDMTNIPSKFTGVDGMVYISSKVSSHKPQLEYKYQGEEISVFIETESIAAPSTGINIPPEVLNRLYEWIRVNKLNLLKHWNNPDDYTSADFIFDMRKVE